MSRRPDRQLAAAPRGAALGPRRPAAGRGGSRSASGDRSRPRPTGAGARARARRRARPGRWPSARSAPDLRLLRPASCTVRLSRDQLAHHGRKGLERVGLLDSSGIAAEALGEAARSARRARRARPASGGSEGLQGVARLGAVGSMRSWPCVRAWRSSSPTERTPRARDAVFEPRAHRVALGLAPSCRPRRGRSRLSVSSWQRPPSWSIR